MLRIARLLTVVVAAMAAGMIVRSANASPVVESTFAFSGLCSDCSGSVTATLTLANYTQGDPLTATNFIAFTYGGSNLLPGFTILADDLVFIEGAIPASLPATARVIIIGDLSPTPMGFLSDPSSFWTAGIPIEDNGTNGIWSVAAVPEPASWALLGASLLLLGAARSRSTGAYALAASAKRFPFR
jgi:hypothetical protein